MSQYDHYKKNVSHLKTIDVYRVLDLYGVTQPAIQHAVKKLLCAGQRGAKNYERDLREAIDSIERALQMAVEDGNGDMATLCNKLKSCEQRGWPYLPDAGDALEAQAAVMRERERGADDGWVEWGGGECPVSAGQTVEVEQMSGRRESAILRKPRFGWEHQGLPTDIIAYRVLKEPA